MTDRFRRAAMGTSLLFCAGLLAGCPADSTPPPLPVYNDLQAEYIVPNAQNPAALAAADDGRVFYTEKNTGRIRVISQGLLQDTPFAEVPVNSAGDGGLLGIALHSEFKQNNRVYVFYTRSSTGLTTNVPQDALDHRVVYFEANGNQAASGEIFVASLPLGQGTTRVSGALAFSTDNQLFVALGDQENPDAAQDATALSGKILRYNDDGSIPTDNPTSGSPIFASGVRDVRGLAFDPFSQTVFGIDRYADGPDEINRFVSGGNAGWPAVAGKAKTAAQLQFVADNPNYLDPIYETTQNQRLALAGSSFNPSTRYGIKTQNQLFYGENDTKRILSLQLSSDRTAVADRLPIAAGVPGTVITNLAFTPAGTLYVAMEDVIFRLAPQPPE